MSSISDSIESHSSHIAESPKLDAKPYPRAVNHVGVGVSDIKQAIDWYTRVLGFTLLVGPFEVRVKPGYEGNQRDVLGEDFNAMVQAHMVSGNGIGIELFQLIDPPHQKREPSLEYWKSGFFHICITDPNIEELAAKIAESGGRQRSQIWRNNSAMKEYRLCYCEDPFGNIIEIYTHSYETLYGGLVR
jgi:catechol 2,3-dioxygenase-like lactoylglutathione lyase family enzyme